MDIKKEDLDLKFYAKIDSFRGKCGIGATSWSRNEAVAYEEVDTKEVESSEYFFENKYYKVQLIALFPTPIEYKWKPGRDLPSSEKDSNIRAHIFPKRENGENIVPSITKELYRTDAPKDKPGMLREFYASSTYYNGTQKWMTHILEEGHKDDVWYIAMETMRNTREKVEQFFLGWSLR